MAAITRQQRRHNARMDAKIAGYSPTTLKAQRYEPYVNYGGGLRTKNPRRKKPPKPQFNELVISILKALWSAVSRGDEKEAASFEAMLGNLTRGRRKR